MWATPRRGQWRAVAVAALLVLAAALPASAQAAPGGPYAMHSMLQLDSPYAFKALMFSEAAAAGASEIRVDASPGALNNPYIAESMWQGVRDYMRLSQQYSLPVLLDLNASNDPTLESCGPGVDSSTGLCGVTNLEGYYNEVATLVRYTAGVIDDFEIVNEPDGAWAFSGTPQQYAGMLATAYAAVHANDPAGRVLLGGIMSPGDMPWLATVFTTPGFDAAYSFDIANVHLRDTLANLAGDVVAWKHFFAFFGDGDLPLWVTETGYPSDPAFQYDPGFRGTDATSGAAEQAAFLARSLPALLFAGAARVFVTERDDDLWGAYSSEGLLGGAVTDADENAPDPVQKPAYIVFQALAQQAEASAAASPAPDVTVPAAPVPAPAPSPAPAPPPAPAAPLATAARARPATIARRGQHARRHRHVRAARRTSVRPHPAR